MSIFKSVHFALISALTLYIENVNAVNFEVWLSLLGAALCCHLAITLMTDPSK